MYKNPKKLIQTVFFVLVMLFSGNADKINLKKDIVKDEIKII